MMTPAMQAVQPQNIPQTTALLMDMKNKGTLQNFLAQHQDDPGYPALMALAMNVNKSGGAAMPPQPDASAGIGALQGAPQGTPQGAPQGAPQGVDPETLFRQAIDQSVAEKDFDRAQKLIKELSKLEANAGEEQANKPTEDQGIAALNSQTNIPDGGIAGQPDETEV
jgi:hypothetical protein